MCCLSVVRTDAPFSAVGTVSEMEDSGSSAAAVASVVSVCIVIFLIICVILYLKKRKSKTNSQSKTMSKAWNVFIKKTLEQVFTEIYLNSVFKSSHLFLVVEFSRNSLYFSRDSVYYSQISEGKCSLYRICIKMVIWLCI